MSKTTIESAFRELMMRERSKNVVRWPEGDIRRDITVVLWDVKESRKKRIRENINNDQRNVANI
jgi:hypothetical protein